MHFSAAERKKAIVMYCASVEEEETWNKWPDVYTAKPK